MLVPALLAALVIELLAALVIEPPALPEPPVLPEPPATPGPGEPATEDDSIHWTAPVGCPAAGELRRGIERRLGRTLVSSEAQVDARVEPRAEGGYRLALRASAGTLVEERTLEADDCRALADATALIVALAIDPVAVAEVIEPWAEADPLEPPVAPSPTPAPTTTAPADERLAAPTADRPTEPEPGARRRPGGLLRAGAAVGLGAVPGVTGAVSLAAGLRWTHARLELEGAYWIPRTSEPVEGARVRVQLGTAAVRGCGQLGRDRLEAPLCGGLQLGGMRGDGVDTPGARAAQGLWLAIEAGVGLSWWFRPRWALAGSFSAAVPLRSPGFELSGDPPLRLFESSTVVGRLGLGIELRL
ncbi:hypothetical protein [Paraliomyxa miuraensis]|uniref:hypothetical protein n=1 Tax=Paraliomyxa miuraensis TaxID=376150 RepID=UPI00225885B0|nr:hypothetical protein [Paraliomyxa miuraensis]MCX4240952.1 hypothetical protein [Paraliomyxa miuraensis]